MEGFGNLPLFGGKPERLGGKKPKRKKRRRKKKKKRRVKSYGVAGLPLFNWYENPDFEGELADTYRNIIREFFRGKWSEDCFAWTEEELFAYLQENYKLLAIACFSDFWRQARKSPKGKLNWVDCLDKISARDWADFTRLVRTKLMK